MTGEVASRNLALNLWFFLFKKKEQALSRQATERLWAGKSGGDVCKRCPSHDLSAPKAGAGLVLFSLKKVRKTERSELINLLIKVVAGDLLHP
ncbi:hypothetical protein [Sphingobacterium suaedae]|uniref:hypothetical protein n=1 Tax=Sphingobacterium suaedae TaxID=1686402 RepID=UPI0036385ABF